MLDLFLTTSVNVYKVCIALEEVGADYAIIPVDISQGEHLDPRNIGGSPARKVPVLRDNAPADGGPPIVVFESGAILDYVARKFGALLPTDTRERTVVMEWLIWQAANLGPFGGQYRHFTSFAPLIQPDHDHEYAAHRFTTIHNNNWDVLDSYLAGRTFLGESYSIADIACFPWIALEEPPLGIDRYPNLRRWRDRIALRPAVRDAYARARNVDAGYDRDEDGFIKFPWEGVVRHVIAH